MVSGAQDQVAAWKSLSSSVRASTKKSYSDAGITLMLSSFGSTDAPTSDGHDAATVAKTHAAFVKQYDLEGIDVDYEGMCLFRVPSDAAPLIHRTDYSISPYQ